jgi:hypothetical protein
VPTRHLKKSVEDLDSVADILQAVKHKQSKWETSVSVEEGDLEVIRVNQGHNIDGGRGSSSHYTVVSLAGRKNT